MDIPPEKTYGRRAQGKVPRVGHLGDTSQSCSAVQPHTHQGAIISKMENYKCSQGCEEIESSYIAGENVKRGSHVWKTV